MVMLMSRLGQTLGAIAVSSLALSSSLHAAQKQWIASSGNWSTPANWDPAGVPVGGGDVLLTLSEPAQHTVVYDLSTQFQTLNSLRIDAPSPGRMTLSITNGSLSSLRTDVAVSGNASVVQSGGAHQLPFGTLTIAAGGRYEFIDGILGATTMRVSTGATLHQSGGLLETQFLIQDGGTFSGTIHNRGIYTYNSGPFTGTLINDGNLILNQDLVIPGGCQNGQFIGGLIEIHPGRTLTIAGTGLHSNSSVSMFGGTLTTPLEILGPAPGEGAIHNQFAGLHQIDTNLHIGAGVDSLYLMRGGTTSVGSTIFVGDGAAGDFQQTGGIVQARELRIATQPSSAGTCAISGGTLLIRSLHSLGTIRVSDSGRIELTGASNQTSTAQSITFGGSIGAWTGRLDIGESNLLIEYSGPSPLPLVADQIRSAFAGGAWTGAGIGSRLADSTQFGVGFEDSSSIRIRVARYGDASLDGVVNLDDFNRLAANFGSSGKLWFHGDFNYDTLVNLADFNLLASNFGLSASPNGPTPQDWSNLASVVPEPGFALPSVLVLAGMLRRFHKGKTSSPFRLRST